MSRLQRHLLAAILCLVLGLTPVAAYTLADGQAASVVLGQATLTSGSGALSASGIDVPRSVEFDSSGNLWVADAGNNRILEFVKGVGFGNGDEASVVLGQTDFASGNSTTTSNGLSNPVSVALDSSGDVWVADEHNNRVLEFTPPFTNGEAASLVLGQTTFTSSAGALSSTGMNAPVDLAFDSSGNLWVADFSNNRVLEFLKGSGFTDGEAASLALGQTTFNENGSATTSTGMSGPFGLTLDSSGDVWVADFFNNRVLEFRPPFTVGQAASMVLGQATFTSRGMATTSAGMNGPTDVATDSSGNVWVSDFSNNRVIEFVKGAGFANGQTASVVLGQTTFANASGTLSATGLSKPVAVGLDPSGNVWVADEHNNRVLEFRGSTTPSTSLPEFPLDLWLAFFAVGAAFLALVVRKSLRHRRA